MPSVPLELMGGLYTEATPESLPLGASPICINCDFILGAVLQRPGKFSAFYFANDFITKLAGYAASIPGQFAPNEVAWTNPTNATKNIPGTYATVQLNTPVVVTPGILGFDKYGGTMASSGTSSSVTLTPATLTEWAAMVILTHSGGMITPGAGFTSVGDTTYGASANGQTPFTGTASWPSSVEWAELLSLLTMAGASPPTQKHIYFTSGAFSPPNTLNMTSAIAQGDCILCGITIQNNFTGGFGVTGITDTAGNTYVLIGSQGISYTVGNPGILQLYAAFNCAAFAGTNTVSFNGSIGGLGFSAFAAQYQGGAVTGGGFGVSQILQCLNFSFSIPATQQVLGFQVAISGHQTSQDATSLLSVQLASTTTPQLVLQTQLPSSDGTVTVGTPLTNWNIALSNNVLNNPNFGVDIVAQSQAAGGCEFDIYAVQIIAWVTPNPAPNFNYLKTFAETGGEVLSLILGSDGNMYQEDAINDPGVLSVAFSEFAVNSFAQSCTFDDREFIAISNLQNGTDMPRSYAPPNFDRLSQVGPGAKPGASTTAANGNVLSITQNPVVNIPTATGGTSGAWILWSNSPQNNGSFGAPATPGNVFTLVFPRAFAVPSYLTVGSNIVLSGVQTMNGFNPNNAGAASSPNPSNPPYYTITSIGTPPPGEQYYDAITLTLPQTGYYNSRLQAGGTIQATMATLTTATQIPNLEVGNQFALAGTGGAPPAGYDAGWTVAQTPNASQLAITATQLQSNLATYSFSVTSGTGPVVGETVTVLNTLNGGGVFNQSNAVITAVTGGGGGIGSGGTFSFPMTGSNINSAPELNASGIIFGTIFQFDAGQIIGNKGAGGSIVSTGIIAAGTRQVCYSFLTRNGFMSQPSPILGYGNQPFTVPAGASGLAITNLAIGPANVIARVIHLTAANGSNFYNIPTPVTVVSNGVPVVNTSTWVMDNKSTSVTLSFSDGVLLAGDQIDIDGNNLFENIELGSCTALVPYSQRIFAVGEQNKVMNFLNWSFDGGVGLVQGNAATGVGSPGQNTYPLGWTVDPVNGSGGSVTNSPLFGFAYQISNTSGSTQSVYGMITQPAFQDEFLVPIIEASTTYSVRVTVAVPTGAASGNLIIDLYSPSAGLSLGSFVLALNAVASFQTIYSGTMLTTTLAPVPQDLLLRIWAQNIPNGVTIVIDRIEPFPTETPNNNTQVIGSYQGAFEQFDRLTGVILGTQQNQNPIVSAFVLFGTLYLVKIGTLLSVNDNNTTEPSEWNNPRATSQSVGAFGPYGVTQGIDNPNTGEEWALIVGLQGLFIFQGSQPIKLSEEIRQLWAFINFAYGYTMWVVNDIVNRRILIGAPMRTSMMIGSINVPNPFIPAGVLTPTTNPTTPNVILDLNYNQLNTASALAESVEIHRSYSGKLIASDIVRKWSIWSIQSPCAAPLERFDNTQPVFLGNSQNTGKCYQLVDALLQDDGFPIYQIYYTAGFVPTETGEGMQLGVTRYTFEYATSVITGSGTLMITVFPNTLLTPYSHPLLPNFTLPASSNGDLEFPINECASRLYMEFSSNAVGSGFNLSRLVVIMTKDPWAPLRGVNN